MTQPTTETTATVTETPAAPSVTPAKPADTPAVPPPAPDPDAAFRAAAKARSDAHKRSQEGRRAAIAAETERAAIAREREALAEERASIKHDPIKYLQRAGVAGDELARHLAGPVVESADERIARLEAKIAENEAATQTAAKERETAALRAQYEATVREHAVAFGSFVDENDADFPELVALAEADPGAIMTEWRRIQSVVAQSGYTYSHAEMAEQLNNFSRPFVEKTVQRYETAKQKRAAKTQAPVTDLAAPPSKRANGADAKAGTTRTLKASLSAENSVNGVEIDRLPEKEQTAVLAEMLKKTRKD